MLPSNKTGPHSYHSLPELQVGALEALMQEVLLLRVLLVQLDHWQFTWDKHRHPESVAEICQCCHAWGWQRAYRSPPPGAAQRTLAALLEQRQRCRKMSKNIRKRRWNKLRMERDSAVIFLSQVLPSWTTGTAAAAAASSGDPSTTGSSAVEAIHVKKSSWQPILLVLETTNPRIHALSSDKAANVKH